MDAQAIRNAVQAGRVQWRLHALERMMERGISRTEVINTLLYGEIIESYIEDRPYPSCLVFHTAEHPLHVVVAIDMNAQICHIITAYRPDLKHFMPDFRTRR
ncbi:MAG: DUF4258 domain-containing protein [Chloroflexi bacterium]|nr:DUF4258 domain-containing protein [Chloroflexota bacterium]